jgi:competence protein CoiA
MKFALVNQLRQVAQPNLTGNCQGCGQSMVAKCGEIREWHWAHLGKRMCDTWWEPETDWHRTWKGYFPEDWQEIRHQDNNGELHIADVKTANGWVIEFQHSYLKPEERRARQAFYQRMVWVVHGTRRMRDLPQFITQWRDAEFVIPNGRIRQIRVDDCALFREWAGAATVPVFFDFDQDASLWILLAEGQSGRGYLMEFPRADFITHHQSQEGAFDKLVEHMNVFMVNRTKLFQVQAARIPSLPPPIPRPYQRLPFQPYSYGRRWRR